MESEHFEVRFLSNEQDFIYNFGVNRGHTLSFSKVNRCYFLSAEAKQLYHNICDYAWGSKRECRPSQATLRAELGWGRHSMEKYLNELRDAGLIQTERQGNTMPLIYRIVPLNDCEVIVHSEIVHLAREQLAINSDIFHKAIEAYRESELYRTVSSPLLQGADIRAWFQDFYVVKPQEPVEFSAASTQTSQLDSSKPNVAAFPRSDEYQAVADPDSKKKGRVAYDMDNPDTWNSHHFTSHFQDLYKAKYGTDYQTASKDVGQIARLVRANHDKKEQLLEKMVHYFILDLRAPKTLAAFCSSHTQATLDHYAKTGKLEFQSGKKSQMALDLPDDDDDFKFANERDGK